jgi:hypothetical protein
MKALAPRLRKREARLFVYLRVLPQPHWQLSEQFSQVQMPFDFVFSELDIVILPF